jgi:hypothetical protein
MHRTTIQGSPLSVLVLLFALILLPWQGQAADLMPAAEAGQDCHVQTAPQIGHYADTTQHAPDSHGHAACCQSPSLCTAAGATPAIGSTPPRIAHLTARYTSFVPPTLAPPPRR